MKSSIFIALMITIVFGCNGQSSFLDKSEDIGSASSSDPAAADATPESVDGPSVDELDIATENALPTEEAEEEPSEDDVTALDECLAGWPDQPFTPDEIKNPTVYNLTENVGNNEVVFTDENQSEQPHLKLVVFDIRIGNQGTMDLLDANGWYCLYFKAKIVNNFEINQQCDSRLAIVEKNAKSSNNFIINEVCPN
jgi:hypothetical protein